MLLRSERMTGVHPDLKKVMELAAERAPWPLAVIEGVRSVARQKILLAEGSSWTMNSRHIPGADNLAKAVDVAPAPDRNISWAWPLYHILAPIVKQAAVELNIPVEWGGDWHGKKADGPHWQLPWSAYP